MAKRSRNRSEGADDGDGDCASGPIEATVHNWQREPWPGKLQALLDGLELDTLDEGSRLYLQRQLYIGSLFDQDRTGHVVMTLRCITESEGNEGALSEMNLRAVSSAIGPFEDRGIALIEAFDQIPLLGVFEQMRALEYFYESEAASALERILKHKLRRILLPPQPESAKPPSKKELIAAEKQATASARRKLVEHRIELGRKLMALRDATPNNQAFGRAVRQQFDLPDSQFVAEIIRVARRYGDRPEMFNAGWRALEQLSSATTSRMLRRKFESKIINGERVTGAEIIRARCSQGRRS
ncbi:hypothetical protein [Bradyrhizobium liaoningense]|uniref:hypothetical protein n=1 Tax=Bradyrhizobium liaoningense TaxID=43992 RepID=UPI001BAA545E|nr:hypothetical protein [Bradyrhizobium liaoningense]MBR0907027.1 hypothetical protein [Bradyrhizobium liaoningense]